MAKTVAEYVNSISVKAGNLSALSKITSGIDEIHNKSKEFENNSSKFGINLNKSAKRVGAVTVAVLGSAVAASLHFEQALSGVKSRMNGIEEFGGLEAVKKSINETAKEFNLSSNDIAKMWGELANFNKTATEADKIQKLLVKTHRATGRPLEDLANFYGKVSSAYDLNIEQGEELIVSMEALANQYNNVRFDTLLDQLSLNENKASIDTILAISTALQMAGIEGRKLKSLMPEILTSDAFRGFVEQGMTEMQAFERMMNDVLKVDKNLGQEQRKIARTKAVESIFGVSGDSAMNITRAVEAMEKNRMSMGGIQDIVAKSKTQTEFFDADFETNMKDPLTRMQSATNRLTTALIELGIKLTPLIDLLSKVVEMLNKLISSPDERQERMSKIYNENGLVRRTADFVVEFVDFSRDMFDNSRIKDNSLRKAKENESRKQLLEGTKRFFNFGAPNITINNEMNNNVSSNMDIERVSQSVAELTSKKLSNELMQSFELNK